MLLTALPFLWIAAGAATCVVTGDVLKSLLHANGPGSGGVFLLLPIVAAFFPLGLLFAFAGLLLFAGSRWPLQLVSAGVLFCCALLCLAPGAIVVALPIAALPALTLWSLNSTADAYYRASLAARRELRLQRIKAGEETPREARILALAWTIAGALVLLAIPLSVLVFRFTGRDPDSRQAAYGIEVLQLPMGVFLLWAARRLGRPTPRALGWSRVLAALLFFSAPMWWLAGGLETFSAVGFLAAVSFWALGLPELRAFAASNAAAAPPAAVVAPR